MKFSTRAEYGLKAITNLAKCYPEKKNIREISLEEKISLKYLERLMNEMRKNKLVKSFKGKEGGYTLAKAPRDINAGEVIEVLDGQIAPMKCIAIKCTMAKGCASSVVWTKLTEQIKKTLYGIKLSDLIK